MSGSPAVPNGVALGGGRCEAEARTENLGIAP